MNYNIRKINEFDYIKVAQLYKKLKLVGMNYQTNFYTKKRLGENMKSDELVANDIIKSKAEKLDSKFFVLEIENNIHGFIYGYLEYADTSLYDGLDYIIGELEHIFIDEEFRGNGFSEKLRDELFSWFKEKKVGLIEIGVNQDNPVFNLYKKWGLESKFCYTSKEI